MSFFQDIEDDATRFVEDAIQAGSGLLNEVEAAGEIALARAEALKVKTKLAQAKFVNDEKRKAEILKVVKIIVLGIGFLFAVNYLAKIYKQVNS